MESNPCFCGNPVAQHWSLFVFYSIFSWPQYFLSVFDLRLLNTPVDLQIFPGYIFDHRRFHFLLLIDNKNKIETRALRRHKLWYNTYKKHKLTDCFLFFPDNISELWKFVVSSQYNKSISRLNVYYRMVVTYIYTLIKHCLIIRCCTYFHTEIIIILLRYESGSCSFCAYTIYYIISILSLEPEIKIKVKKSLKIQKG